MTRVDEGCVVVIEVMKCKWVVEQKQKKRRRKILVMRRV